MTYYMVLSLLVFYFGRLLPFELVVFRGLCLAPFLPLFLVMFSLLFLFLFSFRYTRDCGLRFSCFSLFGFSFTCLRVSWRPISRVPSCVALLFFLLVLVLKLVDFPYAIFCFQLRDISFYAFRFLRVLRPLSRKVSELAIGLGGIREAQTI